MKFPWNRIYGWKVSSLANGNVLIEPDWRGDPPGLFTRLRMANWILHRLAKRSTPDTEGKPDGI